MNRTGRRQYNEIISWDDFLFAFATVSASKSENGTSSGRQSGAKIADKPVMIDHRDIVDVIWWAEDNGSACCISILRSGLLVRVRVITDGRA
ncbi:hypothetical protein JTE90_025913 [Oedothorax gibbosus]|uniref:Uncharacterized protein n=1 Tax=Oedothorax gibbosus TaxID=931172 RepID=A0AAV6UTV0_9ARAC|nr:hypothetical protein JTE90_025913 [Oedothorax gibbosus]